MNLADPVCGFRADGKCMYPRQFFLTDVRRLKRFKTDNFCDIPGATSDREAIRLYFGESGWKACPYSTSPHPDACPFHSSRTPGFYGVATPGIRLSSPAPCQEVASPSATVAGVATPLSTVVCNGVSASADPDGVFSIVVPLAPGENDLNVVATAADGTAVRFTRVVYRIESEDETADRERLEEESFKEGCATVEYRVLEKNSQKMVGQPIHMAGKVFRIREDEGGPTTVDLYATFPRPDCDLTSCSDQVICESPVPVPFYKGDTVQVWGLVTSLLATNGFGVRSRYPGIDIKYIAAWDVPKPESVGNPPTRSGGTISSAGASGMRIVLGAQGAHLVLGDTAVARKADSMETGYWAGFATAVVEQKAVWGGLDEELYGLCRRRPAHDNLSDVVAKVALIGRGYATRIESMVPSANRQGAGSAIRKVADVLAAHASEVDQLIRSLPETDGLSPDQLEMVVSVHGKLTALLQDALSEGDKGDAPKSFVSKYLHFHRPCVPIYDSYSEQALSRFRTDAVAAAPFAYVKKSMYRSYYEHVLSFAAAMASARDEAGLKPTVKEMDAFLLSK